MVNETGSNVIVMLTKEVENDKVRPQTRFRIRLIKVSSRWQIKCTHYWPLEPGNAFTFENMRITLVSEEKTFENRLVERTLELQDLETVSLNIVVLSCQSHSPECRLGCTGRPEGDKALSVFGLARSRPP